MALSEGSWLNHYEILGHLGTGGMGEVYRARDNKLQREVALKVLPKAFSQDPERLGRFRREAQVLAQVNHPNIAAIYSVEESGGTHFLVMELAQGETLRDRIKRGPVPIEEALDIAKQIAAGLEAAHEKPIVHRDLKPANVKVTPEGVVKILDFGLARAFAGETGSGDPADSPTLTGMTQPGTILGTAAYMSPEQARGKTVDRRTDIWALGCVLYEMLTGKRAFEGEDVQDILAGVMRGEPDWTAFPASTPRGVRVLLRRCLEKDAKRRLSSAADLQIQMEDALSAPSPEMPPAVKTAPPPPLWRRAMPSVLTGLAVAALAVGVTIWNSSAPISQPISRLAVPLPPGDRVDASFWPSVAISPDGSHVVYTAVTAAGQQLYLRSLDSPGVSPIPGTQEGQRPFFSPDGEWVGFFAAGKLMKVAVNGGPALTLCEVPGILGATWGPDDTIVFSARSVVDIRSRGLFRVSAAGGMPTVLTQADSSKGDRLSWPEFLPGGNSLLFTSVTNDDFDNAQIEALNLGSGERRVLVKGGTFPHYARTGHLVYNRAGTVMAVPFDPDRLEVTGAPAPVLEGVMPSLTAGDVPNGTGVAQFAFSQTGSLVYIAAPQSDERTLVWVDRNGAVESLVAPPRAFARPSLSPDGRQIAVNIQGQTSDIWVYDIARGTLTRLTFEGNNGRPVWTPDGKRIAFPSTRGGSRGLFWKAADGTGTEEQLIDDKLFAGLTSISPDGRLAFGSLNPTGENDIGIFELQGERKTSVFLKTPFDEGGLVLSPDGRWGAYLSLESGRAEIYVRPFPGPGGKWQISTEGGVAPVWSRNGRELFYASGSTGQLMAVDITTRPTFQAGTPHVVVDEGFRLTPGAQGANYDVSPDGRRFLIVRGGEANLSQLNVVLNWFEELKQRVPTGN